MSSQSSSTDVITTLESIATYLYRFGGLILVVFGSIGCILNIMVFSQKSLRKNPCATYLVVENIFNLLFINSLLLSITLESGYNIYFTSKNIVLCHLCYYTSLFSNVLSSYCLICASIDRVFVTSPNASTRQRSTLHFSYFCIIGGTIFWMLFHSHSLVFTNITQIGENIYMCFYQVGFYLTFISFYSIIKESSSTLLLLICGIWAVKNIRRLRRVALPTASSYSGVGRVTGSHIIHSKDRRFVWMVLIDTLLYAIFCSMAAIFLTHQQITQYQQKSIEQLQLDIFLKQITVFCLHIPFGVSCYTNLLVSKAYRNAMKNVFSWN
ncbi:unnamed protein product [Rotaria sp. Silwood2]|nr:unnamed protein product [Rotaria sp. Silwood2]CAF2778833.1 unnamed protein product [Rotaria sp. Silwood2]CAF3929620.1 unnamed protein product [Rotaria sp. Silwood2]CAF4115862.1 unnamed protein product [Rotaria sp. Silwood2]